MVITRLTNQYVNQMAKRKAASSNTKLKGIVEGGKVKGNLPCMKSFVQQFLVEEAGQVVVLQA